MAKLEIQLGADSAELLRELSASEKLLKDWVSRVNTLKPKVSSTGIVEYSKETAAALNTEAVALAKATTETQQYKAEQAAAAAETAKFRNEKGKSSKVITENSRLYKQLSQRLTEVRKNAQDVGAQFGVNSTQFQKASESVNRLDGRLKSIDSALGVNTRRVGAYGNALQSSNAVSIEFARIIQDAPFGIIGVGNNITQLTSNYAQYAQSVRQAAIEQGKQVSSGSILKGALQGLLTPASLLTIGISAVTTGLTLYTMWQQRAGKASRDAAKEARKSADDYLNSLDQITQARVRGEQSAQGELSTLKSLYRVYTDGNQPLSTRKAAYEQLQSIYPDYFKNIAFEQTASDKTRAAYDKLTTSILATARARAASDLITKNATRQLENEQKIADLEKEQIKNEEQLRKAKELANAVPSSGGATGGVSSNVNAINKAAEAERRVNENLKQRNDLRTDSNILTERNLNLEKEVTKEIANGAKLSGGGIGKTTKTAESDAEKSAKRISEIYKTLDAELAASVFGLDRTFQNVAKDDVKAYEKALDALIKAGIDPTSAAIDNLQKKITELGKALSTSDLQANVGFTSTFTPAKIVDTRLKDPYTGKLQIAGQPAQQPQQDSNYINRAIRSSINSVINDTVSGFATIGQRNYEIEAKYSEMRRGATEEQIKLFTEMERLEKSVSTSLLSTLNNVFQSLTKGVNDVLIKGLSEKLSQSFNSADFNIGGLSNKVSQALVGGAGLAGQLISGLSSPTSKLGQGLGGALSVAATGAALGSAIPGIGTLAGAIGGGILGALGGIFGAGARKKQEELQRQQLEIQKKQLEEQKRANALAYTSSIVGQMTNQGIVTGVDRNAFGDIVFRIEGNDLVASLNRTQQGKKRGF